MKKEVEEEVKVEVVEVVQLLVEVSSRSDG